MTRDEIFEHYRPVREGIQRVLKQAEKAISTADLARVIGAIAPWADGDQLHGDAINMVLDVALFEADRKGRYGFDRFLKQHSRHLSAEDRTLAERMSRARFSLFRIAEKHGQAGLWLENLMDNERRVWLVDVALETSANPNDIIGIRLFEVDPYHAGFGIVVQPGDETLGPCLAAHARRGPLPDQDSLAAQVYSDHLAVEAPVDEDELEFLESFANELLSVGSTMIDHDPPPRKPKAALPKPEKRRRR